MEELIREHAVIMRTVGELIEVSRNHSNGFLSIGEILAKKLEMVPTIDSSLSFIVG